MKIDELRHRAEARKAADIKRARESAPAFIEYAISDEKDGSRLFNGAHHLEWHKLMDEHPLLVLNAPVEHAKSQQVAIGRVLWELGKNPNLRIALIQNTITQASKMLGAIRQHLEKNPRVIEVFPHLRRSRIPGVAWHNTAITVDRDVISKDPSIQALGAGSAILGARLDLIVGDDILNFENTRTQEQIEKTIQWFDSSVYSRVTDGGRVWMIGTPWEITDILHELGKRPGWVRKVYSAILNPEAPPEHWIPLWPEQWPRERLAAVYAAMTPINFARSFLCVVRNDQSSRFQEAWLQQGLELGRGRSFVTRAPLQPSGSPMPCFTGVDLSVGKTKDSDLSVLFTIALDERMRRIVCEIQAGRWQAPEIVNRLRDVVSRFNSIVLVEDNGAQNFLLQWATGVGIPVHAHTTGRNKFDEHFGVESIAVEMRSGHWVIPSGPNGTTPPDEVRAWMNEMLFYHPSTHTGDRLMGAWFAREAARRFAAPMQQGLNTLTR